MSWIDKENKNANTNRGKDYPYAKWITWLFLGVCLLLLIYTFYRSEIIFNGNEHKAYFGYYLISLTGILFFTIVLMLSANVRANIITLCVSIFFGVYLIEAGFTFIGLNHQYLDDLKRYSESRKQGLNYDMRTKREVLEDLIEQGEDAVPTVHGSAILAHIKTNNQDFNHIFPLGGVSNKTTVYNNESGKFMIYKSDRYGFNNPDNQWDSKPVEWLLLGDSFTHGSAVQPGQEIAGQLRSITSKHAISLGIGGNGPLLEYASLVEYGKKLKPKKILWIYYEWNDFEDLQDEKVNPLLLQYMKDGFSQNLINRQKEIDIKLEQFISQAEHKFNTKLYKTRWIRLYSIRSFLSYYFSNNNYDYTNFDNIDIDADDSMFYKILNKAKEEVAVWEGELYFVYLPAYWRYKNNPIPHDRFRKKAEVIDLVKQLDIPIIDIHQEVFANHPDALSLFPFRSDAHFTSEGYRKVSMAIVKGIKNK